MTQWVLPAAGFPLEQPGAPGAASPTSSPCCRSTAACSSPQPEYLEEILPTVDETTHAVVAIRLRGRDEVGSTFVTVLQRYAKALQAHDERSVSNSMSK